MLTRMYTTISPHEMTEDPEFHAAPDLPEVPLMAAASRMCLGCDDDSVVQLPDGREVYCEGYGLPSFGDELPWAERIEQIPTNGAPIVEVDNAAHIDEVLAQWNAAHECMPSADSSGSAGASEGGVTIGSASGETGGGSGGGSSGLDDDARGCACNQYEGPPWWAFVIATFVRRRRQPVGIGSV